MTARIGNHYFSTRPGVRSHPTQVRDIWQHLRPGGRFYFVARTAQGARTLARDVTEVFGTVRELERKSGYRVYEAIKEVEELKS